jgi:hypothetical protein
MFRTANPGSNTRSLYWIGRTIAALGFPFTATVKFTFPDVAMSGVIVILTIETPTAPETAPAQSGVVCVAPSVIVIESATR